MTLEVHSEGRDEMIRTMIIVRQSTSWDLWTKALCKKFENEPNDKINAKLSKSTHEWNLKRTTTFGQVRMKLGEYYNINPLNIEIWVQMLDKQTKTLTWNYNHNTNGRALWDKTIGALSKNAIVCKYFYMKFEIVVYNVKDFDKLILYHRKKTKESYEYNEISELALFKLDIYAPNQIDSIPRLAIIYKKNWKAKQLISQILNYFGNNPIYADVYFSAIFKYIQNNNIKLQQLKPKQFIICQEIQNKAPKTLRMNQIYKMPSTFSKIKYTHFRLQFLDYNDPFVEKSEYKPLWIHFENGSFHRILINKDDTFKDIVCNQISHYFKDEQSFQHIMETNQFELSTLSTKLALTSNLKVYNFINSKSRVLITKIEQIGRHLIESQFTLSTIQHIGNDCNYFEYDTNEILQRWDQRTLQNAINWMDNRIIYNINSNQNNYQRIFSEILMAVISVYWQQQSHIDDPLLIRLSFPKHEQGASLLKLRNILLNTNNGTHIHRSVRILYARYITTIASFNDTMNILQCKNILYFQSWLIEQEYIGIESKLMAIANFTKSLLNICNIDIDKNTRKYYIKKLWKYFDDAININWNKYESIQDTQIISTLSCIIKCIRYFYDMLKLSSIKCRMKIHNKIYSINDETVQSDLIAVSNMKIARIEIINEDFDFAKYGHNKLFETKHKMLEMKHMVKGIKCAWCNKQNKKLRLCKKCKNVWYCSRKHQKLHWNKMHNHQC